MNTKKKGFTLIELLVVIAIIGVLASVVLASLNSARAKAANATVKADMKNAHSQATLFYDANLDYGTPNTGVPDGSCSSPVAGSIFHAFVPNNIHDQVTGAISAGGTSGTPVCNSSASEWVVAVPLKVNEGSYTMWCIDNTGLSKGVITWVAGSMSCSFADIG